MQMLSTCWQATSMEQAPTEPSSRMIRDIFLGIISFKDYTCTCIIWPNLFFTHTYSRSRYDIQKPIKPSGRSPNLYTHPESTPSGSSSAKATNNRKWMYTSQRLYHNVNIRPLI